MMSTWRLPSFTMITPSREIIDALVPCAFVRLIPESRWETGLATISSLVLLLGKARTLEARFHEVINKLNATPKTQRIMWPVS